MIEFKKIEEVNERLKPVDIKGRKYNTVNQRVLGFREVCPNGSITTEILSLENGICVMQAKVYDGDDLLATGTAYEREDSSYINKTSYIENCETSAVGRALGFVGIGAVDSIATAEEVKNAQEQQSRFAPISKKEQKALIDLLQAKNKSITGFADITHNAQSWGQITAEMYAKIMQRLNGEETEAEFTKES
ncbi:MAG: hypothetical protein K5637_01840 [Lachnospiraceae bacterium]|nr:hypothetical protein [Lachnospiraceae bacterium]